MIVQPNAKTVLTLNRGALIDRPILRIRFEKVGPPANPTRTVVGDNLVLTVDVIHRQVDQLVIVVIRVEDHGNANLPFIVQATDGLGLLLGLGQGREQ